jgi:hypothetical protein
VRALFNVPRTSLELLPYYSRMVATLSTCMKDVSFMLLQLLEEEFNFLINKKVCFRRVSLKNGLLFFSMFFYLPFQFQSVNIMNEVSNCKFSTGPNEHRNEDQKY